MDFNYSNDDLDDFFRNVYFEDISENSGGMNINDMFSFYFLLKKLRPKMVIESGIWNGLSTKLIRKTLGDSLIIICLDPRDIPQYGFKDNNKNTHYFTGKHFIDFNDFELGAFVNDFEKVLCFFDDHQNSAQRLKQCIHKNIINVFFNDNYPKNLGSHYSVQHLIDNDDRQIFNLGSQLSYSVNCLQHVDENEKQFLKDKIDKYIVFSNIFSTKIELYEGTVEVKGYLYETEENKQKYSLFYKNRNNYCWNTYLTIKS